MVDLARPVGHLLPQVRDAGPKGYKHDTHRLVDPAETVARVRRLAPAMGITRVANVTGLDTLGIPVVMVTRPNSRSLAVTQGKGLTLDAAKASGLMESVESYHAERIISPLKLASYDELRFSHRVVDVTRLPQLADSAFHGERRLLWIEGHDLVSDQPVWVPHEMVHTDYTLPPPSGSGCFPQTSNGLASGNHLLEAVSHAITELVERDASALCALGGTQAMQRRLDLDTVDDAGCRSVLEAYERAGIDVCVWDTTTDVHLPAFECLIVPPATGGLRDLYATSGHGCHPRREVALLRALTEAAQSRLTLISGARDDNPRGDYERFRDPDELAVYREQVTSTTPTIDLADVPTFDGETFADDVTWEVEQLTAVGIDEIVVVDLTKPEFGLPVVRVVIPGLEGVHRAPGYTPGRRGRAVCDATRQARAGDAA
jgi:ribosomal protein S12 methylthiotransferase accessory factor